MPTSSHPSIAKLQREVREWFPSLSRAQANVLGEMAYGMLMTDGCGMTRMSSYMAELLGQPMNTLRQKYREIYYEKEAKAGVKNQQKKRREIVPEELFADLLRGIQKRVGGGENAGAGPGCQRPGGSVYGALVKSDVSRMWDESGLDNARRASSGGMAASLGTDAQTTGRRGPGGVDRAGDGRSWVVCGLVVSGNPGQWMASVPAGQKRSVVSGRGEKKRLGPLGGESSEPGVSGKGQENGVRKESGWAGRCWCAGNRAMRRPSVWSAICPQRKPGQPGIRCDFGLRMSTKMASEGGFDFEQTKMTNPQRASRLWLVLGLVLQKAIVLGGQLEAEEQKARQRSKRRQSGPKRRRGRPALPQGRPRGREQSVLLRGIMALRAAESGGKRLLPNGQVRAEPLPSRLHAVRRVCKSHQMKKKRREEKKRNKQRAQARARREQRAQERAAKQAAIQARRLEKHEQRVAKQAAIQANREKRKAPQRPPVNQSAPCSQRREAQAGSKASQASQMNPVRTRNLVAKRKEAVPLLRLRDGRLQPPGKQEPAPFGHPSVSLSQPHPLTAQRPPKAVPLLRLSRGRLQPPHRLVRKEIRPKRDHGPPPQAGP